MIIPPTASSSQGETTIYRLKRGTRLSEIPPLPPNPSVPDLSALNGPFQLAEYLSLKIRSDPHDVEGLIGVPVGDKSMGGKAPDKDVWIYEHLRRIPIDLTPLITALLPICNRETCPEMKAHEWLYLCSAHGGGAESCSAIDYILHTLDSTTALLNSSQNFPSRMQIPPSSVSHFPSLFRRLSRIFSHAYFHHREAFQLSENETSLYSRFLGLCEKFNLVGASLLPIPRDAIVQSQDQGDSSSDEEDERGRKDDEPKEKEKRTQSLPPTSTSTTGISSSSKPPVPTATGGSSSPSKPPGPTRNETLRPDQTTEYGYGTIRDTESGGLPKSPLKFGTDKGKNTLGRGKQPRATMHWGGPSGEVPPVPTSETETGGEATSPSPSKTRDRSESIDTVIHLGEDESVPEELKEENLESIVTPLEKENKDEESGEGAEVLQEQEQEGREKGVEEEVPKDEIELLEEQGQLKADTAVAPLAPPGLSSSSSASEEKEATQPESGISESSQEIGSTDKTKEEEKAESESVEPKEEQKDEKDETPVLDISSDDRVPSKGKGKKKLSPVNKSLNSSGSPIPSPIKAGKGKLVPAEISSPAQSESIGKDEVEKKTEEKVEDEVEEKKD
ncbi:hypothetical protein I302_100417 [Kwoniella bestiolae CBS 10118]|uniref:Mob1 family protein n=1 Tax=Kwoniella bestiolae CBS 10118 TaxID=1296100 RepID=A0A1B9G508_9TREE|nr:hypothetical protein I302_03792 [Kwoniella bestiolae CBS 10118]OCF26115.1 hypothetical protein I302_03792 [Kwoniella bestiolae CBS 10118]